ncbi:hypothetical protein PA25_27610 [Pseudoalteromonas sp. A25]|uniref:hypothetical protein n=1 Tax=Pseudoalteromonas sp. A25 TaxID=116092 RepID=UPI001260FF72|nr:hypothetical protein [Pseudoalteromonas sp. A25]BBN82776.1 hypothetical protein PA25_27610 [Pseudoalteromonas sp. A25]
MASYAQAFKRVMAWSGQKVDLYCVVLDQLDCWQTMIGAGFSQSELYLLFKQQYCDEIWQQLRGDDLKHQDVANLLFKASINGNIDVLLSELQQHFNLPISGQMCDRTLKQINQQSHRALLRWLRLSIAYFDLLNTTTLNGAHAKAKPTQCSATDWLH